MKIDVNVISKSANGRTAQITLVYKNRDGRRVSETKHVRRKSGNLFVSKNGEQFYL